MLVMMMRRCSAEIRISLDTAMRAACAVISNCETEVMASPESDMCCNCRPGPVIAALLFADAVRAQNFARSAILYSSDPYQMRTDTSLAPLADGEEATETPPRVATGELDDELP